MPDFRALYPILVCLFPASAQAALEFCNDTDETISVAIGYNESGTWTSEGWWRAEPGACTKPVGGDLSRRYYYWRATSPSYSWETDAARYMFCTSGDIFTIAGDERCEARGYRREAFNEIDLAGSPDFSMTLSAQGGPDPDTYDEPAAGDPGFGAAPGTYGEPYSVSGILSHCDWYDAGLGCTVIADGWSYLATSYDHTSVDTLEALDGLGVNVPISISGDMISYEGSEALVTITDWQQQGGDPFASTRAALQGSWTSIDDSSYQVLIHGARFEEYYGSIPEDGYTMHFVSACTDGPGDGPAFELVARDGSVDRCAYLSGVSASGLELFVAGTMHPLTFRRDN